MRKTDSNLKVRSDTCCEVATAKLDGLRCARLYRVVVALPPELNECETRVLSGRTLI